jgi:hypothetical protein
LEALLQVPATSTSFLKTTKQTLVYTPGRPTADGCRFAFGFTLSAVSPAILCATLYTLSGFPATSRKPLIFMGEKLLESLLQVPATSTSFPKTGKKTTENSLAEPNGERWGFAFCRSNEAGVRLQIIN